MQQKAFFLDHDFSYILDMIGHATFVYVMLAEINNIHRREREQ